jgi:N-acyl-D-amino-acid deacylase
LTKSNASAAHAASGGNPSRFVAFDREIQEFMLTRHIPGGALAVVKGRRLVYAQGYGLADRDQRNLVRPDSLFRIASVSKPITAVAVLKLVEQGRLQLDMRALELLAPGADTLQPEPGKLDERWKRITVRQLLQHTGGWDRDRSFDPMFRSRQIATALGIPSPPGPRDIIRYMQGQSLDFDPGTRYAYSNFGYCILGRIIEKVTGVTYERFVQQQIFAPIRITRMKIGRSLADQRADGEVRYYLPDDEVAENVFDDGWGARAAGVSGAPPRHAIDELPWPDSTAHSRQQKSADTKPAGGPPADGRESRALPRQVPWPYGGFCLESMDAHGGWIASAVDLARFAAAADDPSRSLLKPATQRVMYAPPPAPVSRNADGSPKEFCYGCGWFVRPMGEQGRANYWHTGSLPGTFTLLVRRHDGLSWAALFNQRSNDSKLPDNAIDSALHRAADAVRDWSGEDLFRKYVNTGR